MSAKSHESRLSIVAVAFVASVVVLHLRVTSNWPMGWLLLLQPVLTVLVAVGSAMWRETPRQSGVGLRGPLLVLAAIAAPLLLDATMRRFGFGDSGEVLYLQAIANVALVLAAGFPTVRGERLSTLFAGTCVFVIMAILGDLTTTVLAILFGVLVLSRAMTGYWATLEQKFAATTERRPPARRVVLAATALSLALAGGVTYLLAATRVVELPGMFWSSGGNQWSDDHARDGVGDGNQVRAASDIAQSFGPVDSDIFMESDKPTLFDVASDMYGKPRKPKRSTRAVALDEEFFRHNHQKMARSQQAAKTSEFSTVRHAPGKRPKVENRLSDALMLYQGELPGRLAVETYNSFDDGVWFQDHVVDAEPQQAAAPSLAGRTVDRDRDHKPGEFLDPVQLSHRNGQPWMQVNRFPQDSVYQGNAPAAVKIINLRTLALPSTPCLEAFLIDKVDRPDFFGIGSDGIPRLINGSPWLPEMTVLQLNAAALNLYSAFMEPDRLKAMRDAREAALHPNVQCCRSQTDLGELASVWTQGSASEWESVLAIVNALRNRYEHRPDSVVPDDGSDAATWLLESGGGTDYMFATTAALLCRELGVPARLVSGFYVTEARHDSQSGETLIMADDMHVWVEVSLDGVAWVPIEPTPGFAMPLYRLTLWQRTKLAARAVLLWIQHHPWLSLLFAGVVVFAFAYRRRLVSGLATAWWWVQLRVAPSRAIVATTRLLDLKFRLAGVPRPHQLSPARFHQQLVDENQLPGIDRDAMARFCANVNRWLYHPAPAATEPFGIRQALADCRSVVTAFGFRALARMRSRPTSTTL